MADDIDKLMIEEFKQAGREYTFFQDLALKYLAFYTATLGIITTAFVTITTHKFSLEADKNIVDFLRGDFLSLCGFFLIFMGVIVTLVLLKCRDKAIASVKSLMSSRRFAAKDTDYSDFKKYVHHALSVPRHYKFLSPTQGLVLIIAAINSIAISSIFGFETTAMEGIKKLFSMKSVYAPIIVIACLTFLQYLTLYVYMIKKDKVDVKLKFKPEQNIQKIKLEYDVPRSTTNTSFCHSITKVMFYLTGLTEKRIVFLKRRKAKEFDIKDNKLELKLIAGHYRIIAPETCKKDLLIFGDIYEEFSEEIEFQPDNIEVYENVKAKKHERLSECKILIRKTINTFARYSFYSFLILLPLKLGVFENSGPYKLGVYLFFIYFVYTFCKPLYKTWKKQQKEKKRTQANSVETM